MTPREIILANLDREEPERPGLTFSGDRINDIVSCGLGPSLTFKEKRWVEGEFEYHTDEWGNVWYRIVGASQGGEVFEPAIKDWQPVEEVDLLTEAFKPPRAGRLSEPARLQLATVARSNPEGLLARGASPESGQKRPE